MQTNPNENLPEGDQTVEDAKVYLGERFGLDDAGVDKIFPQLAEMQDDVKVVFKEFQSKRAKAKGDFSIEVKDSEGILLCNLDVFISLNAGEDPKVRSYPIPEDLTVGEDLDWDDATKAAVREEQAFYKAMEHYSLDELEAALDDPDPNKQMAASRRLIERRDSKADQILAARGNLDLKKGQRSGENLDHDEL